MESHTKRIRKARRQGLAARKPSELEAPVRRLQLRGRGMELRDTPGSPRAGERRQSTLTGGKVKRQTRGRMRRATTRRKSA